MADAAARREARRRRILENSQNRLQFISNKSDNDCPRESPIRTSPEQVYETPLLSESSNYYTTCTSNGVLIGEPDTLEPLLQSRDVVAAGDGEVASDLTYFTDPAPVTPFATLTSEAPFASPSVAPFSSLTPELSFASPTVEPAQISICEKFTSHRYDIVLLSLLIQFLYGMSLITFDTTYFFLPLIVYTVTKLIWSPRQNNSLISNILLLLNNMAPARVNKILYIIHCFSVISQDICIFLFTTICVQSLRFMLRDSLFT